LYLTKTNRTKRTKHFAQSGRRVR